MLAKKVKSQDKEHFDELKEMVRERKKDEPVEKVLTIFCHRHGISMNQCMKYYNQIMADENKET